MALSPKSTTELDTEIEEWSIRYRKLEEALEEKERGQNQEDENATRGLLDRIMITRAGFLGSMLLDQRPVVQHLRCHYEQEMSEDAIGRQYMKNLKDLAESVAQKSSTTEAAAAKTSSLQANNDADSFFEEYSECIRPGWDEISNDSDDDSGDSSKKEEGSDAQYRSSNRESIKKKQPLNQAKEMQEQGLSVPSTKYDRRSQPSINHSVNPYQRPSSQQPHEPLSHARRQENLEGFSNSFSYTPPSQQSASNTSWNGTSSMRNGNIPMQPQARKSNPYQPVRSSVPPNNRPPTFQGATMNGALSNNNTSWEEHTNQQNPFFTAREISQIGITEDLRRSSMLSSQRNDNTNKQPSSFAAPNPYSNGVSHEEALRGGPSIPDSLRRKFQPPKRVAEEKSNGSKQRPSSVAPARGGGVQSTRSSSSSGGEEEEELPEELQHLDKELVKKIQNEIMESGETISFDDIAGLDDAKQTIQEVVCWPMKRPDLFTGLRRAPNGLLMYGPPGTGKTMIAKAIAHESGATFFSISSSSLTSKWIGEGEKLVKTLFAVAAYREPAVVFIDEIDSLLTQRKATENEASRRIKTEFLVQLDGTGTSGQGRVLVIGATNKPQELDEAVRRRFTKRLYIPLPDESDRRVLLHVMLKKNKHQLTEQDFDRLAKETQGFSGADLKALCTDAAMGPIRQLGPRALDVDINDVPHITFKHFKRSLKGTKPSVAPSDLAQYEEWDKNYGTKRANEEEDDDDDEL